MERPVGDEAEAGGVPLGTFASLAVPAFRPLYLGGFLFGTARWGLGFLAAYAANDLTSSPRAVQLTGAALWIPMLFAGALAGGLADRRDRRLLLLGVIGLLVPVVVALGLLASRGSLEAWMLYPAMAVVGMSWVVDITARRTMVLDIVGPDLIDNAMAVEAMATATGLAAGVLAGGAVVEALGIGPAFLAVAAVLVAAALLFALTPPPTISADPTSGEPAGRQPPSGRLLAVASDKTLRSVLGVTVIANFFYFSHTPLVPVVADGLGVGPLGAGLLASAGGIGMLLAALVVARRRPPRGLAYVGGAGAALVAVVGLAAAATYAVAIAFALAAATGFGFFTSTQAVATMTSVGPELRGRAMGLLSMAIGALPIGMFTMGELAEVVGPGPAIAGAGGLGAVVLAGWVVRRPEVLASR